jgi:hypothetical protein
MRLNGRSNATSMSFETCRRQNDIVCESWVGTMTSLRQKSRGNTTKEPS